MTITIHPELQSLIPPLSPEEVQQLETNLLQDGCRDPLIIWQEEQILLDGHNRLAICDAHGLPYTTHAISLPDLDAAKAWLIAHQLGRRNLTAEQMSYYRGKQYELRKQTGFKGNQHRGASGKSYQKHDTAQALAAAHKVAEKTIRNDAAYAKAIDTLATVVGPAARPALLARTTKVTQGDVKTLAKIATTQAAAATKAFAAVQEAKTPKQARQIVQHAVREVRDYEAYIDAIARSNIPEDEWPASLRQTRPKPVEEQAWDAVYDTELARRLHAAVNSLGRLHTQLLGDGDWYSEHLPAALGRNLLLCLKLAQAWHLVEDLLMTHETLFQNLYRPQTLVPMIEVADDPRVTAEALFDRMGEEYARAILQDLQSLFALVIEAPPAPLETRPQQYPGQMVPAPEGAL